MSIPYDPVFFRQLLHQIELNLYRIVIFGQSQLFAYPFYMSIYNYTGFMKNVSPNYISRLSSHSGQIGECIQVIWHLTIVLFTKLLAAGYDIFCLIPIKAGGMNHFLQLLQIGPGKILCRHITLK